MRYAVLTEHISWSVFGLAAWCNWLAPGSATDLMAASYDAGIKSTAHKVDKTFHVWTRMNLDDFKLMVHFIQLDVPKQRPPLKPPYQLIKMWIKGIKGVVNISLIRRFQSLEISPLYQPFDSLLITICPKNPLFIYVFDLVQELYIKFLSFHCKIGLEY